MFVQDVSIHLRAPNVSTPSTRAESPLLYLRNPNHSVCLRKLKVFIIFTKAERFHQPYTANHAQFLSWLNNLQCSCIYLFIRNIGDIVNITYNLIFHGGHQTKRVTLKIRLNNYSINHTSNKMCEIQDITYNTGRVDYHLEKECDNYLPRKPGSMCDAYCCWL